MYTLWEIDDIIRTKDQALRKRRVNYAIKRIDETIKTYSQFGINWPALFESMHRDTERLKASIAHIT